MSRSKVVAMLNDQIIVKHNQGDDIKKISKDLGLPVLFIKATLLGMTAKQRDKALLNSCENVVKKANIEAANSVIKLSHLDGWSRKDVIAIARLFSIRYEMTKLEYDRVSIFVDSLIDNYKAGDPVMGGKS